MSLQEDHSEQTRQRLLEAARDVFTEKGFASASTEEIAERAGATRGALYHHYDGKKDLFQALFEAMEQELLGAVSDALAESDTFEERLERGVESFFDQCLAEDVQQIVLLEAPSVLGWETWRAIDEKYAHGLVKGFLEEGMEQGRIAEQPIEPLTQLVLGALTQAALFLARSTNPQTEREIMTATFVRLIEGLKLD